MRLREAGLSRGGAVALGLIAVYAACWGAGLAPPHRGGPAAGSQDPEREVLPLKCVRASEDLGERAYRHVAALVGFGPRDVGSEGWRKGVDYVADTLRGFGLQPELDAWRDPNEEIDFVNVSVVLPGTSEDRIVIGCHHDTKRTEGHDDPAHNFHFVGANDSGSGVGLLLALAETLSDREHRATLELVWLDGEESLDWEWNQGARALFGSRRFVRQYRDGLITGEVDYRIRAFVLLDMVGAKDILVDEEFNSTERLRTILWSAAVACGHQDRFFLESHRVSDDHLPFLDAGIPAVDIIDLKGNPHWHEPTDTLEHIAPESLHMIGEVVLTMLPAVEDAYLDQR